MEERKETGVIVYLCRSTDGDITDLKRSLSLLDRHFNDSFKYPVIIFHEDFGERLMDNIRKCTSSNLKYEKVNFEIPSFLDSTEIPEHINVNGYKFPIGYRHMCRFMSELIFQHPAVQQYRYLWRLDTDSFLLDTIKYDIFKAMEQNDYIYGYLHIIKDEPGAVIGLWEATKKYIEENKINPTYLWNFMSGDEWDRSYYYSNFEISRIDFWTSGEALKFFNYIDSTGGIYKYRWGDHVLHLLTLSMFVAENRVHKFADIAYQHKDFINNFTFPSPKNGIPVKCKRNVIGMARCLSRGIEKRSAMYRRFARFLKEMKNGYSLN